jgi:hypothetical protein
MTADWDTDPDLARFRKRLAYVAQILDDIRRLDEIQHRYHTYDLRPIWRSELEGLANQWEVAQIAEVTREVESNKENMP